MAEQPLRGSVKSKVAAIAATLELALKGAKNEVDLRRMIQSIINNLKKGNNRTH